MSDQEHTTESGAPSTTGPASPVRMNHEHSTGGALGCPTCSPILCGRADPTGKYACNLTAGHDGAHMELTDRHSAAWDLFRSPATYILPPGSGRDQ